MKNKIPHRQQRPNQKRSLSTLAIAVRKSLLGLALVHTGAHAATIEVNSNSDVSAIDAICTLREAIVSLNTGSVGTTGCANSSAGFGTDDSITFANSLLPDNLAPSASTITLTQGQLTVDQSVLTIAGSDVTVHADDSSRVFYSDSATLSIASMTITGSITDFSGGIFATESSSVSLDNVTLTDNFALDGGAIYGAASSTISLSNSTLSDNQANRGGAIHTRGSVDLVDTLLTGNSAQLSGGAVFVRFAVNGEPRVSMRDCTLSNNTAGTFRGGGVYLSSNTEIALDNCHITGNSAREYGGGLYAKGGATINLVNNSTVSNNSAARGGGIDLKDAATVTVSSSTISNNTVSQSGGAINAIYSSSISLTDSTVSGNTAGGYGTILASGSSLSLTNVMVSNNSANRGGGIVVVRETADITNSTLTDNSATIFGGGIFAQEASVTLNNSTLSNNSAGIIGGTGNYVSNGGGIYSFYSHIKVLDQSEISGNSAKSFGGGIFAGDSSAGALRTSTVNVSNSTLSNNSSTTGGGILVRGQSSVSLSSSTLSGNYARFFGGGIASQDSSSISLTNTTVSGNTSDSFGGGIFTSGNRAELNNSTVSDNSATYGGGMFIRQLSAIISNSIIANSSGGGDCDADFGGTISADSASIIEDGSCGNVARTGDPNLLALADNGGPTLTHALGPGSIASNRGIIANAQIGFQVCAPQDQRGELRNIGDNACDVGAFELNYSDNFFVIPLGDGRVVVVPL